MEGMIALFKGRRGSGKTLSMTFMALEFHQLGWTKFLSNYTLEGVPFEYEKISEEFLLNLDKNSNLHDCVILIDEVQIFFDSRLWKQKGHIGFSHFIQQIRKRNIVILATTQYIDTIEKRFRQHTDILITPKFDEETQFCTLTIYDLTSLEDAKIPDFQEITFYAPQIYDYYNTREIL